MPRSTARAAVSLATAQSGGARIVRRGRVRFVCTENRTTYPHERVRATTLRGWPVAHGANDSDAIARLVRVMAGGG